MLWLCHVQISPHFQHKQHTLNTTTWRLQRRYINYSTSLIPDSAMVWQPCYMQS